jgi:predicted AAA+ superfamily ATPase
MYNRKNYIDKMKPFVGKQLIKILTGVRRCGKSSLMKLLIEWLEKNRSVPAQNIIYINKESLHYSFIQTADDLFHYVQQKTQNLQGDIFLLLDEVQMIRQWQLAVNSFLSDNIADIYITGSNSRLLSSELATLLSGRYIEIPILTLTFSEFCDFSTGKDKAKLFKQFLKYGGFPGLHQMKIADETVFQYLSAIFDSILLKDIVLKNNIRNVNQLEKIVHFIFDNIGNIFSAKKVVDFLKKEFRSISNETVYNYIKYLEQSFIVYKVSRYDIKGKKHLEINEKYYLSDIGIRHAALGYREGDISALLENIVFLEFKKRGFNIHIGVVDNLEVDFIIQKDNAKAYVQVCYLLSAHKTIQREFGVLEKIPDNYPKYVLSMDEFWTEDIKGIKRVNILDFLTDESFMINS